MEDRVTATDVARAAGVSVATVSRVINDEPVTAPATAAAVQRVIARLGYAPPPRQQRFRRQGRKPGGPRLLQAALLFPDVAARAMRTPLSAALAHGAEGWLAEHDASLVVTHLRPDRDLPVCIARGQVQGVMLRGGVIPPPLLMRLRRQPCVWVFETDLLPAGMDQALPDSETIGYLACDYLLDRGARPLRCSAVLAAHPAFRLRTRCFCDRAAARGVAVALHAGEAAARPLTAQLRAWLQRPGGLFLPGGETELQEALIALLAAGHPVHPACHVVVCSNEPAALRRLAPRIVNLDIQAERVGRTAAELLAWRVQHPQEAPRRVLIPPRFDEGQPAP